MNPLDQLADIIPPDAVSMWPLAWGYWIALVLVIVILGFGIIGILNYRNRRKVKREALQTLANLDSKNEYYAHKVQVLMKTLCVQYLPLYSSAQMHGEEWKSLVLSIYQGKKSENLAQVIDSLYQDLYFPKNKNDTDYIDRNQKIQSTIAEWIQSSFPCKKEASTPLSSSKIDTREVSNV